MGKRLELHTLLQAIIGSNSVYFQPPQNTILMYPCIIYSKDDESTIFANDLPYSRQIKYKVTVIDKNPDSEIPGKIAMLPMCKFDRSYKADNLNHDVYNLYY